MNPSKVIQSKPRGLTTADKPVNVSKFEWQQIQATVNRGPRPEEVEGIRRAQIKYALQLADAANKLKADAAESEAA